MEKFEKFLPLVATVLTAALGAAGVLMQEWRQRRDDRYRRSRARTEAAEMVAFIEKWIATQKLACSPEEFEQVKQTARQQLGRIYFSLANAEEAKRPVDEDSFFERLLLLYKPATLGGWGLHLLFYLLGLLSLLMVTGFGSIMFSDGGSDEVPLPVKLVLLVVLSFIMFAPVMAIRAWAMAVDKKHRKRTAEAVLASPMLPL